MWSTYRWSWVIKEQIVNYNKDKTKRLNNSDRLQYYYITMAGLGGSYTTLDVMWISLFSFMLSVAVLGNTLVIWIVLGKS